jgi:replicative DNA helicase
VGNSNWINKESLDQDQKLDLVTELSNDLFQSDTEGLQFVPLSTYAEGANQLIKNWGKKQGFLTDLPLDDLTYGMVKGELVILAGIPGIGKSALVANVAINLAKKGTLVGILNLEIKNEHLAGRVGKAFPEWETLPIIVQKNREDQIISTKQVVPAVRELASQGCEVIIVDYLQMLALASDEEYREVSNTVRALKSMAVTNDILVIAISSLNRARTDGELSMRALHGSGKIEFFADIILFLDRDQEDGQIFAKIVKNRNRKYDYEDDKRSLLFDGSVFSAPPEIFPFT